ncbi:hypothetical protein J5N97_012225 [Dioscorea zingiberensis]|uniref:NADP-dependent oxidoreductase domain-containing protein n=1 Tax=Dioscorea zingiberensis TaxID=325984 RepID=A0A9D5CNR4_9LILI|nr:hypothetical protein J5N97_012225 [Dioscorea zingiberensis]
MRTAIAPASHLIWSIPTGARWKRRGGAVRCVRTTGETERKVKVESGKDSLDICRVINGMWQTSGGWGSIDRDDAVDAMLRYADAGLTTFDMADICEFHLLILSPSIPAVHCDTWSGFSH